MNNEPVAWTDGKGNYFDKNSFFPVNDLIPLYTHPAKDLSNVLTDKEITDLWCEVYNFKGYDCLTELDFKFCREIIRKAQE